MRLRTLILAALFPFVAVAGTSEVLVLTTVTALPQASLYRRGLLIENRGPNPIWCALSSAATVVNKAHKIAAGERFAFNAPDKWWCIAETASQVTGAATVVSEVD
jgi:hypothetical protein